MEDVNNKERWPQAITWLFLFGAFLVLLIPAGVQWGLLPGDLGSPWVRHVFLSGMACCFLSFVGLLLLAKRRGKPMLELVLLGALTLLLGSFLAYSLFLVFA